MKKREKEVLKKRGEKGENLALEFLKSKGYRILETNFSSRHGEIDIIAIDHSSAKKVKTLVFVEVKARWSTSFGPVASAITPWKIRKIIKTGLYYRSIHQKLPESLRLDAVLIDYTQGRESAKIKLIKNISQ